ncbi:ATP-binding protein [Xanthobacter sp. YC-JY1]|uniref:ATP-binding protein n=1 Tax=Xanthobacter sp. YC-JY1 TaxID=2419844 RepID=UPI001F1F3DFE|nr:ATP-binding protein [Xanthobacter sp. YC-JY1]
MTERANPLRRLELPRRWEFLAERAAKAEVDPSEVVERVDDAALRIDALLRRTRDGGGGVIEVIYGLSGSGKTTFLQTLPRFFEGVRVVSFPKESPLSDLPKFVKNGVIPGDDKSRIVLIDRRDNPTAAELAMVEEVFGELLNTFREPGGDAVVLWPITKPESADHISTTAWSVGRDSMADADSSGQFHFKGIGKNRYFDLADNTSRTLTGDGLEAFGITREAAVEVIPKCDTISDFYSKVTAISNQNRDETWSILKKKSVSHLWIVLPGDDVKILNATADALTQGIKSKIDIDKVGEMIDRPDQEALYVADWKSRRGQLAHLLRAIDVRLFGLPPNVSLAAVRSFGDDALKARLKQPATNLEQSKQAMKSCRLYKSILDQVGIETSPYAGPRQLSKETVDEFLRIQVAASKDDKPLNKALGQLIAVCLSEDAPSLKVISEKKSLPGSSLQPDIQIELGDGEYICLEPTWRTSGVGVAGEIKQAQNTLSEAHLKKYVLEKATQYVKDMGL